MSLVWQGVSICKACGDDIAVTGKSLCADCAAFQVSLRSLDGVKPVPYRVRPLPWDFWDRMLGVIGGGLIVACLWGMWSLFR